MEKMQDPIYFYNVFSLSGYGEPSLDLPLMDPLLESYLLLRDEEIPSRIDEDVSQVFFHLYFIHFLLHFGYISVGRGEENLFRT